MRLTEQPMHRSSVHVLFQVDVLSFSRKIFPLPVQAAAICDPLKVGRKGITFRCPLGWPGAGQACPHFKCEQGAAARGRYSCTPFSRSPVLGSGINLRS